MQMPRYLLNNRDNIVTSIPKIGFALWKQWDIHPKYPKKVNKSISKYIIKDLVQTEWAKCSIVDATLNLLKEAFINTDNDWFILLSSDVCPILKYNQFIKKFTKLQNENNTKSIFTFVDKYKDYYKTNQQWILNRNDVEIILKTIEKYKHKFTNFHQNGACDEFYFLSVLMWTVPNYKYINMQIIFNIPSKIILKFFPKRDIKYSRAISKHEKNKTLLRYNCEATTVPAK